MCTKNRIKSILFFLCVVFFLFFCFTFPYKIFVGNEELVMTKSEWEKLAQNPFVRVKNSLKSAYAEGEDIDEYIINYRQNHTPNKQNYIKQTYYAQINLLIIVAIREPAISAYKSVFIYCKCTNQNKTYQK